MGAWDEDEFGNDEALTFLAPILKSVEKVANKKKIDEWDYEKIRAAIEIFLRVGPNQWDDPIGHQLKSKLDTIIRDDLWVNNWKDTEAMKGALQFQRKQLVTWLR